MIKIATAISAVLTVVVGVIADHNFLQSEGCPSSEEMSVESTQILDECSAEVERSILLGLDAVMTGGKVPDFGGLRRKRQIDSPVEKRISGCVLQCIFGKYEALDEDLLPSRRGLLTVLTEGVTDRAYFRAISKTIDSCYQHVWSFREQHSNSQVRPGQTCDVTFETFDCIIDGVDDFCEGN